MTIKTLIDGYNVTYSTDRLEEAPIIEAIIKNVEVFLSRDSYGPVLTLAEEHGADKPEQSPVINKEPAVWDLVIEDMRKRDTMGKKKYGTRLQPFNGRDPLWDAYQESLDLIVYLRQAIYEKEKRFCAKKNGLG